MACFDNFIDVKGSCSEVTPTSGLFLDNIGISLPFLEQIVTEGYQNGEALASDKMDFAREVVFNRIYTHFASYIRPTSVVESARIGHTQDDTKVEAGDGSIKGIEVELCNLDSFVDFYLSEMDIHLTTAGSVDVYVYDLLENKLLDTITITSVANERVTVHPNKIYKGSKRKLHLFIGYNSTGLDSIRTSVSSNSKSCCGSSMQYINRFVEARGASVPSASAKIKSNLDGNSYTSGLSVNFSLQCNYQDWMCQIRNMIALPILYASGIEIIDHALNEAAHERTNTPITVNRDVLEARLDQLNQKFENSLSRILQKIRPPKDRICFMCNPSSRNVVILP